VGASGRAAEHSYSNPFCILPGPERGAGVCGRHRRVCHDEADAGVEPCDGVEPVHFAACTFCGLATPEISFLMMLTRKQDTAALTRKNVNKVFVKGTGR